MRVTDCKAAHAAGTPGVPLLGPYVWHTTELMTPSWLYTLLHMDRCNL